LSDAVEYKPSLSGRYKIHVTLDGEPVADSPYTMHAGTPTPVAPLCILRGAGLTNATARKEEVFEVSFRDASGHVAHATELDVYVRTVALERSRDLWAALSHCLLAAG
jgi:hypothetical protein